MAHKDYMNNGTAPTQATTHSARREADSEQLVWLITGTSSGLGLRLVASALARGDRVIATARSSTRFPSFENIRCVHDAFVARGGLETPASEAGRTPRLLDEHAQNLVTLQLDITLGESYLREKVAQATSHWGRIDVLVNNAGLSFPGILEEGGSPMLRAVFETNLFCTVDMTTATLPYIRASRGWVVNIGSRSVWKAGSPGIGPYFASKAALHAYTTTLAAELKSFGVKVLLVAPGAMRTEGMYGGGWFGWDSQVEASSADENSSKTRPAALSPETDTMVPLPPSQKQSTSPQFLEEYALLRSQAQQRYTSIGGTEPGDPAKAMEVLVDYVRREGAFASTDEASLTPTLYNSPTLVLGAQSLADVRGYCEELLGVVKVLEDHGCGKDLNFD